MRKSLVYPGPSSCMLKKDVKEKKMQKKKKEKKDAKEKKTRKKKDAKIKKEDPPHLMNQEPGLNP